MRAIYMRYPGGHAKAVTFSYDDGVVQDMRLAELFHRYGLKATFNLNAAADKEWRYSTREELEEIYFSRGHEVAVHGAYHKPTGNQRPIAAIRDVLDCRDELEAKSGRIIRGMAYPDTGITLLGNFTSYETVKEYLTDLDIAYARTLGKDNNSFLLPEDFHAWMPSAHHDNPEIMAYIEEFLALDLAWGHCYHARRVPRLLYIWGHSYEFDKKDNWCHIEEICRRLGGHDDIYYATNIEIFEYVEAYRRLVYSADSYIVRNPSAIDVFIDVDGVVYRIGGGETLHLPRA